MLLECIRKSRTIRERVERIALGIGIEPGRNLNGNCKRNKHSTATAVIHSKQTDHIRKQTVHSQQSGCSPAPLHSAGYLLVMLVYKYRNNHLKILLKLFYNLRLFDARHPAMQLCSVLFSSVQFGEVQFCSLSLWVWLGLLLLFFPHEVCANSIAKPHYSLYPLKGIFRVQ